MNLLLDTNVVLWLAEDAPRLDHDRRLQIKTAACVHVSLVSIWEIAIKLSIKKLQLDLGQLVGGLDARGFSLLAPTAAHCLRFAQLPLHHRDPFDRLLVAQALEEGLTLMTADGELAPYGVPILRC